MRGAAGKFRSQHQAAALQTIISSPGYSYLVVLPTGGGKSDLLFLSALYERQNRRITLLVVPYVALRHDIIRRATEFGLNVVHWSARTKTDSIITAEIVVFSVESMDSGAFRSFLTEHFIAKNGNSIVARIFSDEAHTTPAFHPQTDGQTERTNQTLEHTDMTPFYASFGYHPTWTFDLPTGTATIARGTDRLEHLSKVHTDLKSSMNIAQQDQSRFYDRSHTPLSLNVGDQVFLSTRNLKLKTIPQAQPSLSWSVSGCRPQLRMFYFSRVFRAIEEQSGYKVTDFTPMALY
ncbi:hypothetical protein V1525DRAFT_433031 [Lipomyces kononenkoae]|uniref:Uncharacterized protein n=1 Tax=Lipomyces kononenkoae TaxID=34357 RepID=A0ACC3SZQ5_LIPKO